MSKDKKLWVRAKIVEERTTYYWVDVTHKKTNEIDAYLNESYPDDNGWECSDSEVDHAEHSSELLCCTEEEIREYWS